MSRIAVSDLLDMLRRPSPGPALIDVRSELEYAKGAIPGFVNRPILMQAERHEVGITYKQQGQQAAIERGAELAQPHQAARVQDWCNIIATSPSRQAVVACWRGGMRSQITCAWLRDAGQRVHQLEGGYKALRNALLELIAHPPALVVVTGLTGSGKTELLVSLQDGAIDLEAAAHHRGSAFGGWIGEPQPAQATFENRLALQLLRLSPQLPTALVEDESRLVGLVSVPPPFFAAMSEAPLIIIEEPVEGRAERIFRSYMAEPLAAQQVTLAELEDKALTSLQALARRLNHQLPELRSMVTTAFARGAAYADHGPWICNLLANYYDRSYLHAAKHHAQRKILFQGDLRSCQQWSAAYLQTQRS